MERKGEVHKRKRLQFRPKEMWKSNAIVLSLAQNRRRKAMGKIFEWKASQRPESVWEEISKTVQRLHHWEMHGTYCVMHGILPCVRITKQDRGADFGEVFF